MPDITGPFIHIMGIGTNTDHARTVARDKLFKPIERIYLIHSPDQTEKRIISKGTKNERILEPIKFKKLAETLKKDLEKTGNKVSLVLLSKDGAYKNTKETINEMTKIIKKEEKKNSFYSSKQFAINVTGGTNMTAVASMLVAGSHQTSAYYVIDERFEENKKLQSNLAEIAIPNFKEAARIRDYELQILKEIAKKTFEWPYTPRPEEKKKGSKGVGYKVDVSINNSEWISPKSIPGAISLKELQEIMRTKYKERPTTISGRINKMAKEKGFIRIEHLPYLTPPKGNSQYKYKIYTLSQKEKLIRLTDLGFAQAGIYK